MKIILAMLVSLSICFTTVAFADQPKTSDGKKYSCGCSKYKQKQKSTSKT